MQPSTTPAPPRDPQSDKVRLFRQLYLAGRLEEVLIPEDARWDRLADAVFASPRSAGINADLDEL